MDADNNDFEVIKVKEEVEDASYEEVNKNYEGVKVKEEVEDAGYYEIKQESIEDNLCNTFVKQECKLEVNVDCDEDEHLAYDENLNRWISKNANSTKNYHEEQFFQCPECSVKTKYEANLKKHISFMHNNNKLLDKRWMKNKSRNMQNSSALQTAGKKSDLLLRKENSLNKWNCVSSDKNKLLSKRKFLFNCTDCSFGCKLKFELIHHVYQCHYNKSNNNLQGEIFVCPYCAKQYYPKQKKLHLAYCKENFYNYLQCDHCDNYFKGRGSLRKHIFSIHFKDGIFQKTKENNQSQTALQPCPKCGRRYQHYSTLSKHIANCGKEHRFKCNTCIFTTHCQYYLAAHILQHLKQSNLCLNLNYGPKRKIQ